MKVILNFYGVAFGRAVRCIFFRSLVPCDPKKDAASIPNATQNKP